VIPCFAFTPELRKILYTTNAIESLNGQVRKAVRVRDHFPIEEASTQAHLAGAAECAGAREKSADFVAGCQGPAGHPV
jgi:transposase-like protein